MEAPPPEPAPEPAPVAPAPSLTDQLIEKLADAKTPLKLAELKKGLKKPARQKKELFDAAVQEALAAATRSGRAFEYPSGKNREPRFWSRDEKHAIREEALRLAATPDTLANLVKKSAAAAKADVGFAEEVVRDLIAEDRLLEHPPAAKGKAPAPRFATTPPPPPPHALTVGKAKTAFAALLKAAQRVLAFPGVGLDDLLARTRAVLSADAAEGRPVPQPTVTAETTPEPTNAAVTEQSAASDVEAVGREILAAIRGTPVASLADVRRGLPPGHRGPVFDAAVLDLSDRQKVILYQDANPAKFTPEERAELVTDGGNLFTTISLRG